MSNTLIDSPPAGDHSTDPDSWTALEQRLEKQAVRRDGWTFAIVVFSAIALIAALVAIGFGARAIDESKSNRSAAGDASGSTAAAPASVDVELSEFAISPKQITVAEGGTLKLTNQGNVPHDLTVKGTSFASPMLNSGGAAELSLKGLAPGTYTIICAVPGHEAAGMTGTLVVAGAGGSSGAAAPAPAAPADHAAGPASSTNASIDFAAKPAADWKPFDPTLKPADGAAVHNVTIHATETVMEVAPGVRQEMWTFNGQVPGPTLRGKVGDVFNVTLVYDGKLGHSIDFHASKVAPNVEMRTLQPGQSLVYQFKAEYAGMWMYHCGTAPALHHIGNGMFGTVVIDPPDLAPVDHEYVMVQSELYLGPDGKPGDLTKMQAVQPDAVVFNGYVNQYAHQPIKMQPGQRARVWVLDAGPSENSSFHIVGTIFDTVYKEGAYTLRPGAGRGGAQALDLQPAQGGFVEFTLNVPGQYPMVTHKFANVGKGALGLFQAGEVAGSSGH